jgi:hypothetical protein
MADALRPDDRTLDRQGDYQKQQAALGAVPAAPTWPIPVPGESIVIPPVGLNWGTVADRFGADVRTLMHDSYIVLAGEYVPETGYFIDPQSLRARRADVGQRLLEHGYLIGRLTANEFRIDLDMLPEGEGSGIANAVVRTTRGPLIGLFSDRRDAERCRDSILSGSIGSGVSLQDGPLGTELRIDTAETAGSVATAIASNGGAVISIAGVPFHSGAQPTPNV